jgi:serine/threonine-protein kinase ULK/ATG1
VAMKEINIMKKLNHPNVIKFIDAKKTDNNIYLIMEFCNGGSLEDLVKSKRGTIGKFILFFKTINYM